MKLQHIYQTKYQTVQQPPGFADFVIGTMSLFHFNNEQLYVDYSSHPISNFLINSFNTPEALFIDNKLIEVFNTPQQCIIDIINNTDSIKIATNSRGYVLTESLRQFIKDTFKPNKIFQEEINSKIAELNLLNFDTIQIRLGDHNINTSVDQYKSKLQDIICNKIKDRNVFLLSDNRSIKDFLVKTFPNIKIIQNNPIHLGDLLHTPSLLEDVKNTLLDFYIMSKSNSVFCCSVYGDSGFSYCCSEIFNFKYSSTHI